MCLFLGINVAVAGNGISEFSFTNFKGAISVQEGWQPSRSLLDCSQLCSLETDCCGLSYNRSGRLCCLIVAEQLSSITGQSQADPKLYLNESCAKLYKEMVSSSTSTATATPTKSSTRESTSLTATTSFAKSTSTSTSASTSTPIPTTKTASTSLPTTPSTKNSKSMTTLRSISTSTSTTTLTSKSTQTTSPTTVTQTTTATLTTTSTPITKTSTTTLKPTTTTTTQTIKCDAHALVCTSSSVHVLTEDTMLQYDDYTLLTTGASTRNSLSSTLPHTTGTVLAGYEDSTGTAIHIIADTVVSYSSDTFQFIVESTLADHFGTSVDFQVDATLLVEDTDTVYIFSGDVMYKASGGQLKSVALDNNGRKNPYRSNNFSDRPLSITAACEISSGLHVFISNNRVYTFQEPEDTWYDLGPLIC